MKFLLSFIFLIEYAALAIATDVPDNVAVEIHKRSEDYIPDGVIAVDIHHKREPGRIGKRSSLSLKKRDASNNIYGSYIIVYGIGTPPQTQTGIVDTGSSDLWVNGPWSGQTPFFNPAQSTSYRYRSPGFYIAYGSGQASGYWIGETLNIAGSNLTNQQLGLVNNADAGQSVFGIGMAGNEVALQKYNNVPQNLYTQGLTKSNSFSIYIDNLSSSTGRILFGGIDHKKYTGNLQTIPVTDDDSFYVDVNEIDVAGQSVTNGKISGLLDSGTTFCYLPTDIARNIARKFNAQLDTSIGLYLMTSNNYPNNEIEFNLSGVTIKVPAKEMIIDSKYIIQGNSPAPYVLGVVETDDMPYILGDTFLRSAYVVFDTNRKEVAIAQASYDSSANITVITDSGILGVSPAPGYKDNVSNGGYKTILTVGAPGTTQSSVIQNDAASKESSASTPSSAWPPSWLANLFGVNRNRAD